MAVFLAKQNSAAKATFLCNFLFLPEKESWRKITTFAPAMNRSRTYSPTTSRRAFPTPPAQTHGGMPELDGTKQRKLTDNKGVYYFSYLTEFRNYCSKSILL
jgi:hypothetical protein